MSKSSYTSDHLFYAWQVWVIPVVGYGLKSGLKSGLKLGVQFCFMLFLAIGLEFVLPANPAWADQAMMRRIEIQDKPLSIKFFVTQDIPVKVIQVEKRELLVALKNVKLEKGFKILGKEKPGIGDIAVESLPGNVIAVILTGTHPYKYTQSKFNSSDSSFSVRLETVQDNTVSKTASIPVKSGEKINQPESAKASETNGVGKKEKASSSADKKSEYTAVSPVSNPPAPKALESTPSAASQIPSIPESSKPIPSKSGGQEESKVSVKIATPTVYVPPKRETSQLKGDISDITRSIDPAQCDSQQINNSILLLKKGVYKEAFEFLDQYIFQENFTCLEQAYFLRAYAFYKITAPDDFAGLLKAERFFQDALVAYPKSMLVPYGYAAIGMIQKRLNNDSAAEGYFNIVKQGYLQYSGLAEVMYHLAQIYDSRGYEDKALRYFKQVFEDTMENSYIPDAGIGYGKALFKKRQYLNALMVLNYVTASNPKKVYETPEVLLHIGNANFEVGESRLARQNLNRVLNLFPGIEGRDVILNKIGDTYGMENNKEKAVKVYELVREKFPDSEGYIASSIGIARYMTNDPEKIEIYTMIKARFPEHSFSRIAMMRLAEIYQANEEYDKCIKEIEDLLSTHPRGLRYEAVKLMQRAYEALFQKQLKADEYTRVLNRYELEHERLDRMGSRKIALTVGLAYLQAKLYEESFNHLINAYKQYPRASRSEQLLLGLGIAMDESGRKDDALKLLNGFVKRFPKSRDQGQALSRSGDIYLDQKNYTLASQKFHDAFKKAKNPLDRGNMLMRRSNVFEKKGDMETASNLREKAVKEMALASGENYEALTHAYKELGRTYAFLKHYVRSADAYLKALSFSEDDQEKANLGFLLGDAYQKGNIIPKARQAFQQVVTSYDSVWARLAQQRLNTLDLAEAVQNS